MAVVLALYFATIAVTAFLISIAGGYPEPGADKLRLVVLGLRDPALPVSANNAILFGLLLDDCNLSVLPQQVTENGTAVVQLPVGGATNGYYLEVAAGPAAADPVAWRVDVAGTTGVWKEVWASVWRGPGQGAREKLFPLLPYSLTPDSDHVRRVKMDMRPRWPWVLNDAVVHTVVVIFWICFAAARQSKFVCAGARICALQYSSVAILGFVSAIGLWQSGDWRGAW